MNRAAVGKRPGETPEAMVERVRQALDYDADGWEADVRDAGLHALEGLFSVLKDALAASPTASESPEIVIPLKTPGGEIVGYRAPTAGEKIAIAMALEQRGEAE